MKLDHLALLQRCGDWALVTGASSGIGAQFCKSLAAYRFNIVLVARREHRLLTLAKELEDDHQVKTVVIPADLANSDDVNRVIARVQSIDIGLLVLNAGVDMLGAYLCNTPESVQSLLAVNVTAVATFASTIGRSVAKRGRGAVIFVSSLGARPTPYMATYAASKAFVSALGLALHEEWRNLGVDVMVFEPGVVQSEMADRFFATTGNKLKLPAYSSEKAVDKCLRTLGKRANCTTGVRNAIYRRISDWLPHSFTIPLSASNFRRILPAEYVDVSL